MAAIPTDWVTVPVYVAWMSNPATLGSTLIVARQVAVQMLLKMATSATPGTTSVLQFSGVFQLVSAPPPSDAHDAFPEPPEMFRCLPVLEPDNTPTAADAYVRFMAKR